MFILVLSARTYQLSARYFAGYNHQRLFNTQWPHLCSRDAQWRSHNTQYFLSGQSSCDTCQWTQHSTFKREIGKEAVSRNWEGRSGKVVIRGSNIFNAMQIQVMSLAYFSCSNKILERLGNACYILLSKGTLHTLHLCTRSVKVKRFAYWC